MSTTDKANRNMSNESVMESLRSYAFATGTRTHECLDESRCSRFVDGPLTAAERTTVVDHLAGCQACLDMVTDLIQLPGQDVDEVPVDLLVAAQALGSQQPRVSIPARYQWQTKLAAAASLVLVIGAVVWQYNDIEGLGSTDEAPSDVRFSAYDRERLNIVSPTGNSIIDPADFDVRWSPVERSVFYEIQLLTDDGDVVWEGRTEDTRVQWPQDQQLNSGDGYFLWVKAHLSDGKTIKSGVVFIRTEENDRR